MSRYTLSEEKNNDGLFRVLDNGEPTDAWAADGVTFADACRIHGGEFHGGWFRGGVFHGGVFRDGAFRDGVFHGGWFHGGVFRGGEFHGGEFRDGTFHGGWLPLQIQGSAAIVNIPDGKHIAIGCLANTPDHWLENYESIGRRHGYTDEQIAEYKLYIDLAAEMIRRARP